MMLIVSQTGRVAQLLITLIHDGYSIEDAAARIADPSPAGLSARGAALLRAHYTWIADRLAEGVEIGKVGYTYSLADGLRRVELGEIAAA